MKRNLKKSIYVTQPSLPEIEEFIPYLRQIWNSKVLTNNGSFHREFELKLAEFLGVPYISLFANGTLALITAIKVLGISGEVITTPYSFVATANSLVWNNIKPVFVDIESEFCTLDPEKILASVTSKTSAILPVHVYGNPCNIERIAEIADVNGLKVIYDAAHAFGVNYKEKSICNYGDISILSFHATKMFNTMEGGAIICKDSQTKRQIDHLKNFGFVNETDVVAFGINSKMNEIQAALGILQLKNYDIVVEKRRGITQKYREGLKEIEGITFLPEAKEANSNYSYFPVFVDEKIYGISRDQLYNKLITKGIYGRRYFYPLINEYTVYKNSPYSCKSELPIAKRASESVICLPIFPELDLKDVDYIINCFNDFSK